MHWHMLTELNEETNEEWNYMVNWIETVVVVTREYKGSGFTAHSGVRKDEAVCNLQVESQMLVYVFFLFEYSERNEWMNKYLTATANAGSAGVTYCQHELVWISDYNPVGRGRHKIRLRGRWVYFKGPEVYRTSQQVLLVPPAFGLRRFHLLLLFRDNILHRLFLLSLTESESTAVNMWWSVNSFGK